MTTEAEAPAEGAGDQPQIELNHEMVSRGKHQIKVSLGTQLIHCDTIKLDDARERGRFRREAANRIKAVSGSETDADDLEPALLAIIEDAASQPEDVADPPISYVVVEGEVDPDRDGIYAQTSIGLDQMTNFSLLLERDITLNDGGEMRRSFEGTVSLRGFSWLFRIAAEDFGNGHKLIAAIFTAAGPKAVIHCRPEVLPRAISTLSQPTCRAVTTDFGWNGSGDAYLSPSVRVDAEGVHSTGPDDPIRIDLGHEQCARHLDLLVPVDGELAGLKRHVIEDLLRLHDRRVTFSLLAAAALAVLFRFVPGMNRPALWLVGLTGGGKSFAAKLFQNFFGDFPVELGSAVGSWSSTVNFLQRQGYFFNNASFLIDDFKQEVTRHAEIIRLLQNYADGSTRGRLNSDATTNVSREIRGILIATGESTPDQSPSSMARTVIVAVPSLAKDVERGRRCLARRRRYPALMAGFVHRVIAEGRGAVFADRVVRLQEDYYGPIASVQNDLRIASNLALLGAALEEFFAYLGDEGGAELAGEARAFLEQDLPLLRDEMVRNVRDQQPSEIFLATLGSVIEAGRVQIQHRRQTPEGSPPSYAPTIGRLDRGGNGPSETLDLNMPSALEAVQESLRRQGRPPLAITAKGLLAQLAEDGHLVDRNGRPIAAGSGGDRTRDVNIAGSTRKAFRVRSDLLIAPEAPRRLPNPAPSSDQGG